MVRTLGANILASDPVYMRDIQGPVVRQIQVPFPILVLIQLLPNRKRGVQVLERLHQPAERRISPPLI